MTHSDIVEEADNILARPFSTNIHRYYWILCRTLDTKYKSGLGLTSDERRMVFDILCSEIEKSYLKLEKLHITHI